MAKTATATKAKARRLADGEYREFLQGKRMSVMATGIEVESSAINPKLFPYQRDIVRWALKRGRAAVFLDCGMGKSAIQLEWARHIYEQIGGNVLILAPLAVAEQTVREGIKFGIAVTHCRTQADVRDGINIANYERLHHFDHTAFCGIVLDESSILKSYDGTTRKQITEFASTLSYRLACTATPAPNDLLELTNHAEFLGVMQGKEILALFFTQDGNTTHSWRLKGHARRDFWTWMASWSVAMRKPSDLLYSDDGFIPPSLNVHQIIVDSPQPQTTLFAIEAQTLQERRAARRESTGTRVGICADLVNASSEAWVIWCDLNIESEQLHKAIPGSVEVRGSDTMEHKEKALCDFSEGRVRVMVTKPSIAGHGLNWQHCHNVAFVGLSDSFEQYYQAVRRCWRFGQTEPVECYVITAETEGAVVKNIERKERQAADMMANIVQEMQGLSLDAAQGQLRDEMEYQEADYVGHNFKAMLGDSVVRIDDITDNSIGLSIFSPPFPGMYAYTNSPHDMGNVRTIDQMLQQYRFLIPGLLRVTMPGRSCCVHLTQAVAFKGTDGYIGIKDFRGRVIEAMEAGGFIYYGEAAIEKDPQVKAIRTKDRGLLFKSLANDSSVMHMALNDYLLQFVKPGDNPHPIRAGVSEKYANPMGWVTQEEWIEWAAGVWYRSRPGMKGGIRETNVLNVSQARETDDERHLCPLQLDVIERAVKLWSNPGDTVLSPFMGIGSEGYVALQCGRKFVGIELKPSYFNQAIRNLERASNSQPNFFGLLDSGDGQEEATT